ncbi:MAG: hypothetical protein IJF84_09235 [Thermoguttaceae bacterium]|nr:hypothetical protein [Thermoguttaceae bacterium]
MKSSVQLASIALSAAVGLYAAFIIVCLMPQKSEFPVPGEIGGENATTLASSDPLTDSTTSDVLSASEEQNDFEPSAATEPAKLSPVESTKTVSVPETPPLDAGLPETPGPIDPDVPSVPEAPAASAVPEIPSVPAAPSVPKLPARPEVPSTPPAVPAVPSLPDMPASPEVPSTPPAVPQAPAVTDNSSEAQINPAVGSNSAAAMESVSKENSNASSAKSKATLISDNLPGTFSMPEAPAIPDDDFDLPGIPSEPDVLAMPGDAAPSTQETELADNSSQNNQVIQTSAIETEKEPESPNAMRQPSFEASEAAVVSDARADQLDPMAPLPPGLFSDVKAPQSDDSEQEIHFGERSFVPRYVLQNRRAKELNSKTEVANSSVKAPHSGAIGFNAGKNLKTLKKPAENAKEPIFDTTYGYSFDPQGKVDIRRAFEIISEKFKTTIMLSPNVSGTVSKKANSSSEAEFLEKVLDGTEYFVKFGEKIAYIGNRVDIEKLTSDFDSITTQKFSMKESDMQILEWLIAPQLTPEGRVLSKNVDNGYAVIEVEDYRVNLYEIGRLIQLYNLSGATAKMSAVSLEYIPADGAPFDWSKITAGGDFPFAPIEGISNSRAVVLNKNVHQFLEQLSKMQNVVPIAVAAQPLGSPDKAEGASLSIKVSEVQNYPADWNSLPQNVGFVARIEDAGVSLNLALPTGDPQNPEGLMFTMSDSELLAMVVPITVTPLEPAKALGFIPKVWENKPAPIQKYVLLVFAVENSASAQKSTLDSNGRKYWSAYFAMQSNKTDAHFSSDQKAFYAKISRSFSRQGKSPSNVLAPISSTKDNSLSLPSPDGIVKSDEHGVVPVEANPADGSMPAVITNVEIPDIDMAAERAKAKAAMEEQKAREEQQAMMAQQQQNMQQQNYQAAGRHNHRH